jgi:acetolactate synthase-1/2/3 large subunit
LQGRCKASDFLENSMLQKKKPSASACLPPAGGAFSAAGRIAASLGATMLCEALPARIDRGQWLPNATRLPYFPQEAAANLAKYDVLLLLDVRRPVAQFGYK